jgi:phosphonate transport system substrate-binding protein
MFWKTLFFALLGGLLSTSASAQITQTTQATPSAPSAQTTPAAALTFGVLNQQSPLLTAERWNPIFNYLQQVSGIAFVLRMGQNVQATDATMGGGGFDLVFTNHNFHPKYDGLYRVIASWGDRPVFGVIAVAENSPLRQLKDLAGKTVAYPSRDAFMAYAVPKAALKKAGVQEQEVLAGNQDSALGQLSSGLVDAAAVNSRFLSQYAARKGFRYRELLTSEPYPDLAVLVHPRVPPEQVKKIQAALIGMKNDPRAVAILEQNQFCGFSPASEKDFDSVRRAYRQSEK